MYCASDTTTIHTRVFSLSLSCSRQRSPRDTCIFHSHITQSMTSPATKKTPLPPTMPVTIKKETKPQDSLASMFSSGGSSGGSNSIPRKDSIGWGADDFLGMISHTPPAFSPGSLTMPMTKRGRSGSISSRLLSASDLEERGVIDRYQKGVLKVCATLKQLPRVQGTLNFSWRLQRMVRLAVRDILTRATCVYV